MTKGTLEVYLDFACDLKKSHLFGRRNPYVLISYVNEIRKSTVAKGHGRRDREWKETHKFEVDYPDSKVDILEHHHHQQYKLTLRLMDKRTCCFNKDNFIGESTVYVTDLLSLGAETGTSAELRLTRYPVVLPNKSYHGEIQLGVTFTRKVEDVKDKDLGGWKESLVSE